MLGLLGLRRLLHLLVQLDGLRDDRDLTHEDGLAARAEHVRHGHRKAVPCSHKPTPTKKQKFMIRTYYLGNIF